MDDQHTTCSPTREYTFAPAVGDPLFYFCYPGVSVDGHREGAVHTCNCPAGFETVQERGLPNCRQIADSNKPALSGATVSLLHEDGEDASSGPNMAKIHEGDVFYTNAVAPRLRIKFDAEWKPSTGKWPEPVYRFTPSKNGKKFIADAILGIGDVQVTTAGLSMITEYETNRPSFQDIARSHTEVSATLEGSEARDGASVSISLSGVSAGRIVLENGMGADLKNNQLQTLSFQVRFDMTPPYPQSYPALAIDQRITTATSVSITWPRWLDDVSGVGCFSLQRCDMRLIDDGLSETTTCSAKQSFGPGSSAATVQLPDGEMLSSILLTVLDIAAVQTYKSNDCKPRADAPNNFKAARVLVLSNPNPSISVTGTPRVIGYHRKTDKYCWQRRSDTFAADWKGVFSSSAKPWLGRVAPNPLVSATAKFDQVEGVLPLQGTPHVAGIHQFRWKLESLSDWTDAETSTSLSLDGLALKPNVKYDFLVEAVDVYGTRLQATAGCALRVDKTPPTIRFLGLHQGPVRVSDSGHFVVTAIDPRTGPSTSRPLTLTPSPSTLTPHPSTLTLPSVAVPGSLQCRAFDRKSEV